MTTRDRRPFGNRSPYEVTGQGGGKIMKPAEKIGPETKEECDCVFCTARRAISTTSTDDTKNTLVTAMMDNIAKSIAGSMSGRVVSVSIDPEMLRASQEERDKRTKPAEPPPKAKEIAAEKSLRGPVEKFFLKTRHSLSWDDVVGNETARRALVEAIEDPIKHRDLYAHYGRKPTKGVLLYGPPGCGKTMFGKAAASVLAELHGRSGGEHVMLHIKGPEIQSPYIGVTEETIRAIFAYARAYRDLHGYPLVVFIDEADAILPSRDGAGGRQVYGFEESNVATFLTEMDGLEDSGALVILATNRPEAIDAAILRDGRCDRKIKVERPNWEAAAMILQRALAGVPLAPSAVDEMCGWQATDADRELRARTEFARRGAVAVFAAERVIVSLATDKGPQAVRLSDIVNGAMLVGLIEQAKGNAFRRDLAAGGAPSGLIWADLEAAITAVVEQNCGMNQLPAVLELCQREGFQYAQVVATPAEGPPLYGLAPDGSVLQLQ